MKKDILIFTETIKKFNKYGMSFDTLTQAIYKLYKLKISDNINININQCDRNVDGYYSYDEYKHCHCIEINTRLLTGTKET